MLPRPTTHSKALGPGVAGPELAVATSAVLDRPPAPSAQRPISGAQAFSVNPSLVESADGPRQHTQYPYVTGTSVLAVKFAGGVMLAADTLGAYGSTKRYKSLERIVRVNARTLVAAGGEVSDFQYITRLLDELTTDDYRTDDGIELGPREVRGLPGRMCVLRSAPERQLRQRGQCCLPCGAPGACMRAAAAHGSAGTAALMRRRPPGLHSPGVLLPDAGHVQPAQQDGPAVELAGGRRR
jgi:hypothetical protein